MEKILGLDLGTNSIGWALRDTSVTGNQIIDKGVLIFDKGIAINKDVEEPKVKKRTECRGKRRAYQAKKYSKWELIRSLIELNMCPLTLEELRKWSIGNWEMVNGQFKNTGRKYPQSERFIQWLRYDFDGDGKPDFERFGFSKHENCYLFRMLVVSETQEHKNLFKYNPYLLGRVLYQLVQRRGYKGRNEEEADTIVKGSEKAEILGHNDIADKIKQYKTLGAALYYTNKEGRKIRKRYNLRTDFEYELKEICRVQSITEKMYQQFWKAIIWQRPLRSQKGLVGLCTFEANKPRCPISHPLYEEFRTWIFINNLKIVIPEKNKQEQLEYINQNIYPLFNKKVEDFNLSDIAKVLDKVNGKITANFKYGEKDETGKYRKGAPDTKVISNKLTHKFNDILGADWKERYDWKNIIANKKKEVPYSYEDIWHVLLTFDNKENLNDFGKNKLLLNEKSVSDFSKLTLQTGFATLSLSAIKKILPFLQNGFIYSDAIYLANMHKVLGLETTPADFVDHFSKRFPSIKETFNIERNIINAINGLISLHVNSEFRYCIEDNRTLDEAEKKEVSDALIEAMEAKKWECISDTERKGYIQKAESYFLEFLRKPIRTIKEKLFYKTPRLHDLLLNWLQSNYNISEENKKFLWHPSEQETYLNAKKYNKYTLDGRECFIEASKSIKFEKKFPNAILEGRSQQLLGYPQPISKGFKNPMALKTLFKLKLLINHLLKSEKIDENTRVVIEIARELNDANRRKAIERWQHIRKKENEEFAKAIIGTAKVKYPDLDENDPSIINKFRLWFDQIENGKEVMNQVKNLNSDVAKLRLWSEQKGQCLYTGKTISLTELFDGSKFNIEHTIPASISFDNELKNLTIADATFNREVKSKKLPTECPNYHSSYNGYTAIKPRLKWMEEKIKTLEKSYLGVLKRKSDDREKNAEFIQRRHLLKFELDYWKYKYFTFTCSEYKSKWRNNQLKDTQIITKYALPYLKTIFKKTEVQKGEVTAVFREIYQISPRTAKKDRSKHSHHVKDAATLTLIPPAVQRDQILFQYYENKETGVSGKHLPTPKGWKDYNPYYILSIDNEILVNYIPDNRFLTQTKKFVRTRGKVQYLKYKDTNDRWHYKLNEKGQKIPLIANGDTIRGPLHDESIFAAIKQPEYKQVNNKFVPETDGKGNFIFEKNTKRDDGLFFVMRPLKKLNYFNSAEDLSLIVEPNLREYIKQEINNRITAGASFEEAIREPIWAYGRKVDKNGNHIHPISNIRCHIKAGGGFVTNPTIIKNFNSYISSKEYKQKQYAMNGMIPICAIYESIINNKAERELRSYSLLEVAKNYKMNGIKGLVEANIKHNNNLLLHLRSILQPGQKTLFFKESIHELKDLWQKGQTLELSKRLYFFTNVDGGRLLFIHHLCSLPNDEIASQMEKRGAKKGAAFVDFDIPFLKLRLSKKALNMAIEGLDFETLPDGQLRWLL